MKLNGVNTENRGFGELRLDGKRMEGGRECGRVNIGGIGSRSLSGFQLKQLGRGDNGYGHSKSQMKSRNANSNMNMKRNTIKNEKRSVFERLFDTLRITKLKKGTGWKDRVYCSNRREDKKINDFKVSEVQKKTKGKYLALTERTKRHELKMSKVEVYPESKYAEHSEVDTRKRYQKIPGEDKGTQVFNKSPNRKDLDEIQNKKQFYEKVFQGKKRRRSLDQKYFAHTKFTEALLKIRSGEISNLSEFKTFMKALDTKNISIVNNKRIIVSGNDLKHPSTAMQKDKSIPGSSNNFIRKKLILETRSSNLITEFSYPVDKPVSETITNFADDLPNQISNKSIAEALDSTFLKESSYLFDKESVPDTKGSNLAKDSSYRTDKKSISDEENYNIGKDSFYITNNEYSTELRGNSHRKNPSYMSDYEQNSKGNANNHLKSSSSFSGNNPKPSHLRKYSAIILKDESFLATKLNDNEESASNLIVEELTVNLKTELENEIPNYSRISSGIVSVPTKQAKTDTQKIIEVRMPTENKSPITRTAERISTASPDKYSSATTSEIKISPLRHNTVVTMSKEKISSNPSFIIKKNVQSRYLSMYQTTTQDLLQGTGPSKQINKINSKSRKKTIINSIAITGIAEKTENEIVRSSVLIKNDLIKEPEIPCDTESPMKLPAISETNRRQYHSSKISFDPDIPNEKKQSLLGDSLAPSKILENIKNIIKKSPTKRKRRRMAKSQTLRISQIFEEELNTKLSPIFTFIQNFSMVLINNLSQCEEIDQGNPESKEINHQRIDIDKLGKHLQISSNSKEINEVKSNTETSRLFEHISSYSYEENRNRKLVGLYDHLTLQGKEINKDNINRQEFRVPQMSSENKDINEDIPSRQKSIVYQSSSDSSEIIEDNSSGKQSSSPQISLNRKGINENKVNNGILRFHSQTGSDNKKVNYENRTRTLNPEVKPSNIIKIVANAAKFIKRASILATGGFLQVNLNNEGIGDDGNKIGKGITEEPNPSIVDVLNSFFQNKQITAEEIVVKSQEKFNFYFKKNLTDYYVIENSTLDEEGFQREKLKKKFLEDTETLKTFKFQNKAMIKDIHNEIESLRKNKIPRRTEKFDINSYRKLLEQSQERTVLRSHTEKALLSRSVTKNLKS